MEGSLGLLDHPEGLIDIEVFVAFESIGDSVDQFPQMIFRHSSGESLGFGTRRYSGCEEVGAVSLSG